AKRNLLTANNIIEPTSNPMYNAIGVSSPVGGFSTSFFPLLSDSPAATPFSSLFDDELVVSLSSLLLFLLLFEVESSLSSSSFDSDDASGTSLTSKCACAV